MDEQQIQQLSEILEHTADALDVPERLQYGLLATYEEVSQWIKRDNEANDRVDSELYPQGSMRLGTLTRPVSDADEYDIDFVYRRDVKKQSVSQEDLKSKVGEQLRRFVAHKKRADGVVPLLEEGRRCWTLTYDGGDHKFHVDVLPSIPDDALLALAAYPEHRILITDSELTRWQSSNPKGYAEWFYGKMRQMITEQREFMAKAAGVKVEDVPEWKIKTPLQRVVQLLKRHRDIRFTGDEEDKPISIIITTLAAHAYGNQTSLQAALSGIVRDMPKHIYRKNGVYWIPNPVNPDENFADKWEQYPDRAVKFFTWLKQVDQDLTAALAQRGINKVAATLSASLGKSLLEGAMTRLGNSYYGKRQAGALAMTPASGIVAAGGSIKVPGHTFFGHVDRKT